MNLRRTWAIARKEFIHIRRDPRSLLILLFMPVLMMFIFGYAINMDLKHIRVGICDLSRTPASRATRCPPSGARRTPGPQPRRPRGADAPGGPLRGDVRDPGGVFPVSRRVGGAGGAK